MITKLLQFIELKRNGKTAANLFLLFTKVDTHV